MSIHSYQLGTSVKEQLRLEAQAELWQDFTTHVLLRSGLREGMRVLDVGTGVGDLAFIASEIVGPTGDVLGIDGEEAMTTRARHRAELNSVTNVRFKTSALSGELATGQHDFVIGRMVAGFQDDAAEFLSQVVQHVNEGGVIVFLEETWQIDQSWTTPITPPYDNAVVLLIGLLGLLGYDANIGRRLGHVFRQARLPTPVVEIGTMDDLPSPVLIDYIFTSLDAVLEQCRSKNLSNVSRTKTELLRARVERAAALAPIRFRGPRLVSACSLLK